MQLKRFLFSVIVCLIAVLSSAVADTDQKTVASKAYVDSVAETKQDVFSGTEGTVVVYEGYDDETGQTLFGEAEIYDGSNDFDEDDDSGKLITAGVVHDFAATMEGIQIPDNRFTCYNEDDCTLWEMSADNATIPLVDVGTFAPLTGSCFVAGASCTAAGLSGGCCEGLYCNRALIGGGYSCANCKTYSKVCSNDYECCSGYCKPGVSLNGAPARSTCGRH